MRRRNTKVVETKTADSADLRAERARTIREVRRLEWDFDRHSTLALAAKLSEVRASLEDLEERIAIVTEEVAARELLERVEELRVRPAIDRINSLVSR